jgi:hypothetical protein
MHVGEWTLRWVVCHRATHTVSRSVVRCPLRGPLAAHTCLGCRFLTTSSIERDGGPWCDAWAAPRGVVRTLPLRTAIPVVAPLSTPLRPPDWPLHLPVLVPGPAVRPQLPVPSGHGIGT